MPGWATAWATPAVAASTRSISAVERGAVERGQADGDRPGVGAGPPEAEVDQRLVVAGGDAVAPVEPRRHLTQRTLATVDEVGEDVVDGVEVGADGVDRAGTPDRGGGDAEVEVDVGVDAEEEVLEDHRPPARRRVQGRPPRRRQRLPPPPRRLGVEVAGREEGGEALHALAVLEHAGLAAGPDRAGDGQVHRGEVAGAILPLLATLDDPLHPADRLVEPLHLAQIARRRDQVRTNADWLAVASNVPSSAKRWAMPWP